MTRSMVPPGLIMTPLAYESTAMICYRESEFMSASPDSSVPAGE